MLVRVHSWLKSFFSVFLKAEGLSLLARVLPVALAVSRLNMKVGFPGPGSTRGILLTSRRNLIVTI